MKSICSLSIKLLFFRLEPVFVGLKKHIKNSNIRCDWRLFPGINV
jgi:hypothetical protein